MRILMLSQFYPPTIGGEERFVRTLSAALVARGHEVAVATLWHKGLPEFDVDGAIRVYRIRGTLARIDRLFSEAGRRHAPPLPDPELTAGLRQIIAHEQPDIVHAHNWIVHSFLPLKAWSKARLVMSLHDFSLACAKKTLMYGDSPCSGPGFSKCLSCAGAFYGPAKGIPTTLANWAMSAVEHRTVDIFLPVSHATAAGNQLPGSGLPYEVIPNFVPDTVGADDVDLEPVGRYLEQLPSEGYLLFVGDLRRDKGIEVLLAAYRGLAGAPPLVMIGRRCDDTPAELPPNAIMLESWPHTAVMEAWRRSMVAIVPSVWNEPFGIVAIEAMATGRPVIASRIGGLSDIVADEQTGILVPPGDVAALRTALARLIADPDERAGMGEAGRERVSLFKVSTVVPRIEAIYRQVLGHVVDNRDQTSTTTQLSGNALHRSKSS
jgi:glycosyltransferase involved in cell wall biosynthesis